MPSQKRRRTSARITRNQSTKEMAVECDDESELGGNEPSSSLSSIASLPPPPSPKHGNKKRKMMSSASRSSKQSHHALIKRLFSMDQVHSPSSSLAASTTSCCVPPLRSHSVMYHRPLLLDGEIGRQGRRSLLAWFDSVSESRSMPWRKSWVDPSRVSDAAALRETLERRAYEVWISEIMLQQTRVAAVIDYWNRWMARWPTIQDLATAKPEEVLAAWSGLGYYSRATRIHEAAKLAVNDADMKGLLPSSAKDLEAKMPGVGRYTAGAISCIVFGRAEPMVDGNVLRVLSRQLGIHGNIKTDKAVIDTIWAAADAIVKATAALDGDDTRQPDEGSAERERDGISDRPGRWGQGLMELGSTVCTPKPNCSLCPITATCRAYQEGEALADKKAQKPPAAVLLDIEDVCTLCEPFENSMDDDDINDEDDALEPPKQKSNAKNSEAKSAKQPTLAAFAFTRKTTKGSSPKVTATSKEPGAAMAQIINHARKFPIKVIKKAVREEETLVCAIRRKSDGQYLIQRRPLKGLLAGLWELPSQLLHMPASTIISSKKRAELARSFVSSLLGCEKVFVSEVDHVGDLGSVPWLFSHIKLTMHVHLFTLDDLDRESIDYEALAKRMEQPSRWVSDVDAESMGTGMRKCWALVKEHQEDLAS